MAMTAKQKKVIKKSDWIFIYFTELYWIFPVYLCSCGIFFRTQRYEMERFFQYANGVCGI